MKENGILHHNTNSLIWKRTVKRQPSKMSCFYRRNCITSSSEKRRMLESRSNILESIHATALLFVPKQAHYIQTTGKTSFLKINWKTVILYAKIKTRDRVYLDLRCAHTNFRRQILDRFATKAHLSLGQESVIINSSREGNVTIFRVLWMLLFHFKYVCPRKTSHATSLKTEQKINKISIPQT